jgi:hypothetical protein
MYWASDSKSSTPKPKHSFLTVTDLAYFRAAAGEATILMDETPTDSQR